MKKILLIFGALELILCLTACTYNPPEGYTKEHHTYEEILAFAQSVDPNAKVSEKYIDTTIDDWNRSFREYPAVVNGVECHVSSVGDNVWNSGFFAGEFTKQYYVIDTDYDYLVLKQIVSEQKPDWSISEDTLGQRYNRNNVLSVYIEADSAIRLTDEELNAVWEQAKAIRSAYHELSIRKELYFWLPAPQKTVTTEGEEWVNRNSRMLIENLEEDPLVFIDEYHKAWESLESGLPIYD